MTVSVPTLKVEIGLAANPLSPSPTWTDITSYARLFTWTRGRQHILNRFEPGHGSITLLNNDRRFDPTNTAGPYYPNLTPNVRFRITATWAGIDYVRLMAFAQKWDARWPDGAHSDTVVELADILSILAQADIPAGVWALTVPTVAPGNLQAWWRLSESTGATTAIDQTGMFNAIYQTPAVSVAGLVGSDSDTAQTFAGGANDFIGVQNPAVGALTDFTVTAMFNLPTVPAAGCTIVANVSIGDGDGSTGFFQIAMLSTGQLRVVVDNSQVTAANTLTTSHVTFDTAGAYNDGLNHMVMLRKSGAGVQLYVDVETPNVGSATLTLSGGRTGGETIIGFGCVGTVDEVALFSTGLSLAQRQSLFNAANPSAHGGGGAARLSTILTYVGIDPAELAVDGTTYTNGDLDPGYAPGGKALGLLQDLTSFSQGLFFANASGVITAHGRQWSMAPPANQSQGTFSDSVTSTLPYRPVLSAPLDIRDVANNIAVSRSGGLTYRAIDAASVAAYGPRDLSGFTDLPLATDLQLVDLGNFLLGRYKTPANRVASITMLGNAAPNTLYPQVLTREIGDRITVQRHPPGGGSAYITDQIIEAVTDEWTAKPAQWKTTWALAPADSTLYFVLDDTTSGVLDAGHLGY